MTSGLLWTMRLHSIIALLVLFSCACVRVGTSDDGEAAGTASAGSGGASGTSGTGPPRATGVNCGVDSGTGVALCLGISSCPALKVDSDQYPDCGFRVAGSAIDLECVCGDALCPMGLASSCAEASSLLADQSAQAVCAAVAEGRCASLSNAPSSSSACDNACRAECSGSPGCITLCGC